MSSTDLLKIKNLLCLQQQLALTTIIRRLGFAPNEKETQMGNGTVKWFNELKGYGFIEPDDGGADLFIHYSGITDPGYKTLLEGQRVSYDTEHGPKGPFAVNVVKV